MEGLPLGVLRLIWDMLPITDRFRLRVTCRYLRAATNDICTSITFNMKGIFVPTLLRPMTNIQELRIIKEENDRIVVVTLRRGIGAFASATVSYLDRSLKVTNSNVRQCGEAWQ